MKDFDYYSKISSDHYSLADADLVRSLREECIVANRYRYQDFSKETERAVIEYVCKRINEMNEPYHDERARLTAEFWDDARAELGYESFLAQEGVAALESKAYEDGHSAGFSEVFGCLSDLTEFARVIARNLKGAK